MLRNSSNAMPGAPINLDNVVIALAAFQRTIEPGEAPFDRWIAGDEAAIPDAAKRGFVLFHTEAACSGCQCGWRFTDDRFHDVGTTTTDQRTRARTEERPEDAIRVQDADAAIGRIARALSA